ncbi:YuiB family protein [Aquibacillus salsiterrae]|uniref:YuiB family protein n=1 Tax=Aquibacillus salsiterrae TaxID=2950439 RepID=A0A9X3WJN9_9BACI|nr:YuiB family protein [Aquibacillus salsiterrae]MDC3418306.1 YuiB family protein [Aquibacillus salsiterrae]
MLQFIVSIVLFFVLFFGISFILNMLLRKTWIMSFVYPIIVLLIVDDFPVSNYFSDPITSISSVWNKFFILTTMDVFILLFGFIGTLTSGFVIRMLRKNGYRMF